MGGAVLAIEKATSKKEIQDSVNGKSLECPNPGARTIVGEKEIPYSRKNQLKVFSKLTLPLVKKQKAKVEAMKKLNVTTLL